jgi:hypothetical protein
MENHTHTECPIKSRPTDVIQCLTPCKCIEEYELALGSSRHGFSDIFEKGDIIVYDIGDGLTTGTILYADKEMTDARGEVRTDNDGMVSTCHILRFATWKDIENLYNREIESNPLHIRYGLPLYPVIPC